MSRNIIKKEEKNKVEEEKKKKKNTRAFWNLTNQSRVHEKYSFYLLYIMEIHVSTSYHKKKEFICKQCLLFVCCCYVIMYMDRGKNSTKKILRHAKKC